MNQPVPSFQAQPPSCFGTNRHNGNRNKRCRRCPDPRPTVRRPPDFGRWTTFLRLCLRLSDRWGSRFRPDRSTCKRRWASGNRTFPKRHKQHRDWRDPRQGSPRRTNWHVDGPLHQSAASSCGFLHSTEKSRLHPNGYRPDPAPADES
ncbi:hypothetical protein D1872_238340 [compost metagenome]